ncbi:hypothetical protein ILUMI_18838 [Ignelater luminosus]|uniref:Integrase catalytic domain-containing protein n=1 Tax=Ignelater luminosus TaxID=2038154 RepID=A0A8K0CH93_IGNLU|nr:hypothetical protein ILUMI_18838 [Ignelater luminosus]
MEFKRNSVIALYLAGKSQSAIVRELEHIKVNRKFVYRTINRYNETGSVVKRYGGGPKKTATSPEMVRKVKKRLERNPRRSGNQMAKELNISQSSIRRILQNELQVKAYKKQKAHDLTPNQKKVRFERAKELLRLAASGEFPNIVFSDEKNFPIEQFVNTQNDRVYLTERTYENLKHRLVTRSNYPSQIMVWAAVTATGRSPLVFIEPGVKDDLTKFSQAYPIPNYEAETISREFVNKFISNFGIRDKILADQGADFVSNIMKQTCKLFKTEKLQTSAYHPQSNGALERSYATLADY